MLVLFSDVPKERNKYIKNINDANQILKNSFDSFILDDKGLVYQSVSRVEFGYHIAFTNLHEYLCVPEGKMIKISANNLFATIKNRKKELSGYGISNNIVHFITDTGDRIIIGNVLSDREISATIEKHRRFINILNSCNIHTVIDDDEKDSMVDKNVLNKEYNGYKMILTHKLLPQLKKSEKIELSIYDYENEDMFIGIFSIHHKDIQTMHFYKFLKI